MRLKTGLPPGLPTSSKVVFRTFLVTLKTDHFEYSSCINDCRHDFEKVKHHEKHHSDTFIYVLKLPSSVYDYVVINGLNPSDEWYIPGGLFLQI